MSNKPQATNPTEANRPGLPESAERGTGDAAAQPVVAGVGIQGAPPPEVLDAEKPDASAGPKPKPKKPEAPKSLKAWFRVKGPGSVKVNGQWFAADTEVELTRTEALSVDEYLEEIETPG